MVFDDCPFISPDCGMNIEECTCEGDDVKCSKCRTELTANDIHSELMEWGSTCVYRCPKCGAYYRQTL